MKQNRKLARSLEDRSKFIHKILAMFIGKEDSILEIGCGDGGHLNYLKSQGYNNLHGLDEVDYGGSKCFEFIEGDLKDLIKDLGQYDIVYTASCLFLIEDDELVKKVQDLATKYLVTFEGEVSSGNTIFGRDYSKVFDLEQVFHFPHAFNQYGHCRVFKVK